MKSNDSSLANVFITLSKNFNPPCLLFFWSSKFHVELHRPIISLNRLIRGSGYRLAG